VASSNRTGIDEDGQEFGGAGWIVDPLGAVIAETTAERPVVAAELDLELVGKAQCEYPCYVEEL
jgi:N-carbamoylputrescine amidase